MRLVIIASVILYFLCCSLSIAQAATKVIDQDGKTRDFYSDVLGSGVAIVNFVYTRCEGVCPNQGRRFEQLQTLLKDRLGDKLRLVSVSIDPERDTPENLKAFGDSFHRSRHWTLVTGQRQAMDEISKSLLGMTVTRSEHSPFIAVRKKSGEWQRLYGLSSNQEILKTLDEG